MRNTLAETEILLCIIFYNIVSIISHCESRPLSENSARYNNTLYMTMF